MTAVAVPAVYGARKSGIANPSSTLRSPASLVRVPPCWQSTARSASETAAATASGSLR